MNFKGVVNVVVDAVKQVPIKLVRKAAIGGAAGGLLAGGITAFLGGSSRTQVLAGTVGGAVGALLYVKYG